MDTNFVIKIAHIDKMDPRHGIAAPPPQYWFHLFTRTSSGVLIPVTTDGEPMCMSEKYFHEFTSDLRADVYNDDLLVLRNGVPLRQVTPTDPVMVWARKFTSNPAGSFLAAIANAVLMADDENILLMMPLLRNLTAKYPNR